MCYAYADPSVNLLEKCPICQHPLVRCHKNPVLDDIVMETYYCFFCCGFIKKERIETSGGYEYRWTLKH